MKKYRLLKDLPNCPKGTVFEPIRNGESYASVLTDEEVANGKKRYSWPKSDVEYNMMWFALIDEENE